MNANVVEVHLFSIGKARSSTVVEEAASLLSENEKRRLDKISDQGRRREFLCSRTFCKPLIARLSGFDAKDFDLESLVKRECRVSLRDSFLGGKERSRTIFASLSHHEGLIAFAVTTMGPIGIDVERWDREVKLLTGASENERRQFFRDWTQREAEIKAGPLTREYSDRLVRFFDSGDLMKSGIGDNGVSNEKLLMCLATRHPAFPSMNDLQFIFCASIGDRLT